MGLREVSWPRATEPRHGPAGAGDWVSWLDPWPVFWCAHSSQSWGVQWSSSRTQTWRQELIFDFALLCFILWIAWQCKVSFGEWLLQLKTWKYWFKVTFTFCAYRSRLRLGWVDMAPEGPARKTSPLLVFCGRNSFGRYPEGGQLLRR